MTLKEKLEISKKAQEKIQKNIPLKQKQNTQPKTIISNDISTLDNAVFGAPEQITGYDANEEMKRIHQRISNNAQSNFSNSKLPSAILESIRKNPLNIDTDDIKMNSFTEKLSATVPSIQRSLEIQKKLNEDDTYNKQKTTNVNEKKYNGIDYEMIKLIVENAIKKEFSSFNKTTLEEGAPHTINTSSIKVLKITEGGKFIVLDNDSNLYECSLRYIGKNKKRKVN